MQKQKRNKNRKVNEKFLEKRTADNKQIQPKNDKQGVYLSHLVNNQIIIAEGSAGVGKSYVAARYAAQQYDSGKVDKIIVARPNVLNGNDTGTLPGTEWDKLYPLSRNILDTIRDSMERGKFETAVKRGNIELSPIEKLRGRSFDDKVICLFDEVQSTTPNQMRSIVTRIGKGCTLVLMGDTHQKDINGLDGLSYIKRVVKDHNIPDVGMIQFTSDDIVRSGVVKDFVKAFEKEAYKDI